MREAVLRQLCERTLARAFGAARGGRWSRANGALVAGALLAAAGPALAQDGAGDVPPARPVEGAVPDAAKRIADLERKVEELERQGRKGEAPRIDEKAAVAAVGTANVPQFAIKYNEGFVVHAKVNDQTFSFRPRGGVQLDYRAFPHAKPNDQFVLRRTKVGFDGAFGDFNYDIEAQPLRPNIPFIDAWLEWASFKEIKLRVGHFKTPFSLDNGVTLDFRTDFVERPMVVGSGNVVAPDYHPGGEVLGSIGDGLVNYWFAVQNQVDSSASVSGDPLMAARVEVNVGGFSIGTSAFWERLAGIQTSFQGITPGQFQFFKPVSVHGWTQAYELDACFYAGPFWARSELVYAAQERRRCLADNSDGTELITQGAYGTIGFVFWGPAAGSPRPAAPFKDWELFSFTTEKKKNKRFVGAELVCRFEWISIDDARDGRKGQAGVPATTSTAANADKVRGNQATAFWLGLNVSPIENVTFMANYVHLRIGDQARAEGPHAREADEFLFRAQLDF